MFGRACRLCTTVVPNPFPNETHRSTNNLRFTHRCFVEVYLDDPFPKDFLAEHTHLFARGGSDSRETAVCIYFEIE